MSGLYYNLALRNSDVRDKDSEKLYYCVLKNRGMVDQETFINYLSQISGGKMPYVWLCFLNWEQRLLIFCKMGRAWTSCIWESSI